MKFCGFYSLYEHKKILSLKVNELHMYLHIILCVMQHVCVQKVRQKMSTLQGSIKVNLCVP